MPIPICWIEVIDGVGAIYERPKNRCVVGCVRWVCFQWWSASKSIPLGAGRDVARSYIALAFGRLGLNCLRGGIGGGIVPYKVYWNMGPPMCPFASSAIGMRSILLQSKSPMTASPGTGGLALVLLVLLSFFLSKS